MLESQRRATRESLELKGQFNNLKKNLIEINISDGPHTGAAFSSIFTVFFGPYFRGVHSLYFHRLQISSLGFFFGLEVSMDTRTFANGGQFFGSPVGAYLCHINL